MLGKLTAVLFANLVVFNVVKICVLFRSPRAALVVCFMASLLLISVSIYLSLSKSLRFLCNFVTYCFSSLAVARGIRIYTPECHATLGETFVTLA